MAQDYYQLLGVDRGASDTEIKKGFRKLARELHPDVNRHDPEGEEKFKRAAEAYEVLSDPERRRVYDAFGEQGLRSGGWSPRAGGFGNLEDILESFFGRGDPLFGDMFGFSPSGPASGGDRDADQDLLGVRRRGPDQASQPDRVRPAGQGGDVRPLRWGRPGARGAVPGVRGAGEGRRQQELGGRDPARDRVGTADPRQRGRTRRRIRSARGGSVRPRPRGGGRTVAARGNRSRDRGGGPRNRGHARGDDHGAHPGGRARDQGRTRHAARRAGRSPRARPARPARLLPRGSARVRERDRAREPQRGPAGAGGAA